MTPFVRSAYNYDMNKAGDESGLKCLDKTLTRQEFKEESDINTIVERFHITGELPQNVRMPTFADFTGVFDFQSAMNAIRLAQESFAQMDAKVRARFNNDAQQFLEFTGNEENRDEAIKLGLVPPKAPDTPPPAPLKVEVVNPTPKGSTP